MLTTLAALICAVKSFDPSIRPRCLVTGQATEGWNQINSPQFPKPVPGKMECLYILTAPKGSKIELHFDQFELLAQNNPSCAKQGLALLDPFQTNVPGQTEIFCGLQKPVPYVSRGEKLFLKFESATKGAVQPKGFLIKYRIRPTKAAKALAPPAGEKSAKKNKKKNGGNRSGGKIMAMAAGGSPAKNAPAKNIVARKPSNTTEPTPSTETNVTLAVSDDVNRPQERANFYNDNPVAEKQAKSLGGKTDQDTKRMLKYMLIGLGACAAAIVVFLMFRSFTGKAEGLPEPELKLPEGTLPTHMRAIQEHKQKMKSLGKEYKEDSD
jgi:hypothetical protein